MKRINIEPHTLARAEERGATEEEIRHVLTFGSPVPAKYGRSARTRVFPFQSLRLGHFYEQKRIEVIYVEDEESITTVTVYVFFGKWEE